MDNQQFAPLTMNHTYGTLAVGTTTTLSTTGTITYSIKGKLLQKTAISNGATPTTDFATGKAFLPIPIPNTAPNLELGYGSVYVVGFDKAGTLRVVQGTIEPLDVSGNFVRAPQFGGLGPAGSASNDNDFCPIGYFLVQLGSTAVATWTFGTNNLAAGVTGVTVTAVNISTLPDRPQVS